jgi:hypothetical protein
MRRREFILAFGGAAVWPVVPRAQQSPMPVIGILHSGKLEAYANNVLAALEDLGNQLKQMERLGGMSSMLGLRPGRDRRVAWRRLDS